MITTRLHNITSTDRYVEVLHNDTDWIELPGFAGDDGTPDDEFMDGVHRLAELMSPDKIRVTTIVTRTTAVETSTPYTELT